MNFLRCCVIVHFEYILKISTSYSRFNNNFELSHFTMNRPGFPGECFICELRLPDHRFRWKHNKLFLLL
ncbi:hypothetical protein GBT19_25485, partial [Escherichia coli]|nr:hypothetical protein [Escherichia coli]NNR89949.1 hypothetical protein [Escherichia coli]